MSSRTVSRRVLDSALPSGELWRIKHGDSLDKFYDALAANFEILRDKAIRVEHLRNPEKTDELDTLEIEYGIFPDTAISEANRRLALAAVVGERSSTCPASFLEGKLRAAGFDVRVYDNDPPIDPADIMMSLPLCQCGDIDAQCGAEDAQCGYGPEGDIELIVNGDMVVTQSQNWTCVCGSDEAQCGAEDAQCGAFEGMARVNYPYVLPRNPGRWPRIFWIAERIVGNERFADWNMEWATCGSWAATEAALSKTKLYKSSGIRSLLVQCTDSTADGYAQSSLATPCTGTRTVSVSAWCGETGTQPGLQVADKDGVWDTGGTVYGIDLPGSLQTLSYSATNGVSAVRLIAHRLFPTVPGSAAFDDLRCEGLTIDRAQILWARKQSLRKLILRYKPMRTWCGLLVDYTSEPTPTPGSFEEDDMSYRGQEVAGTGGHFDIVDGETAVHLVFWGSGTGFEAIFDDANNFTLESGARLFRLTNRTASNITVRNSTSTITGVLLPDSIMDCTLTDNSDADGDWLFACHVTGTGGA